MTMEAAAVTPNLVLGIARQIVEQPGAAPKATRDGMRAHNPEARVRLPPVLPDTEAPYP